MNQVQGTKWYLPQIGGGQSRRSGPHHHHYQHLRNHRSRRLQLHLTTLLGGSTAPLVRPFGVHTVDGKNPAPLRVYEGVALSQLKYISYPLSGAGIFPSTVCEV